MTVASRFVYAADTMPLQARTRVIHVRLTPGEHRRAKREARRDGLRLAEFTRLAVQAWTEQRADVHDAEVAPKEGQA